jgi:hypothetical protein
VPLERRRNARNKPAGRVFRTEASRQWSRKGLSLTLFEWRFYGSSWIVFCWNDTASADGAGCRVIWREPCGRSGAGLFALEPAKPAVVYAYDDYRDDSGAGLRALRRHALSGRRRAKWRPGCRRAPRGGLRLAGSCVGGSLRRQIERPASSAAAKLRKFCGSQGITPRPGVLPYRLVGETQTYGLAG